MKFNKNFRFSHRISANSLQSNLQTEMKQALALEVHDLKMTT
jgi:hypothetical protein